MQTSILAFIGSFCAGILFNVKSFKLFFAGLSGLSGWLVYLLILYLSNHTIIAIFAGAIAVGIFSETAARVLKTPSTIFSIPGIFPLVPGIAAYESIRLLSSNDLYSAGGKLVETLAGAGAIAFGILLVTAMFRFFAKPKPGIGLHQK